MVKEKQESDSWKYCSRCMLAEEVGCEGRSEYCTTALVTPEMIAKLKNKGLTNIDEIALQRKGVIIRYKAPGLPLHKYITHRGALNKEDVDDAKELLISVGAGTLAHEHDFPKVNALLEKTNLEKIFEDEIDLTEFIA